MSDSNAGIWFAEDGYNPDTKGLNGRRVAGASFLRGLFRHADVSEFVSVTHGDKARKEFLALKNQHAPDTPHRAVYMRNIKAMAPVGVMYYPAPNFEDQLWQRQPFGMQSYSICGITHTTATRAVMQSTFSLRAGPQAEWDGLICTSRSVHAAISRNFEIVEDFLRARFGHVPPRPQLPIIPLGINCDEFAHDPEAAARLRTRMGWTDRDVAVVTIARLLPYGKFDPGPLFMALQKAQQALSGERRLHFIACGVYGDEHSEKVFNACAKALMPDVTFHHFSGDDAVARRETLSGGDIFAFPIDNVQETFGLAPLEAMAAGLPVVVSDWDGMRDTVTPEVGIRVPTRFVGADASTPEARGYLTESLSYQQYGNRLSMMTEISMRGMVEAFTQLARDEGLRHRLGRAGQQRAQSEFDWRVILPKMQAFWAELNRIRRSALTQTDPRLRSNPIAPLPGDVFASYPTARLDMAASRLVFHGPMAQLDQIFEARRYAQIKHPAETLEMVQRVATGLAGFGTKGACGHDLARELDIIRPTVERSLLFLLKYGLVSVADTRDGDLR